MVSWSFIGGLAKELNYQLDKPERLAAENRAFEREIALLTKKGELDKANIVVGGEQQRKTNEEQVDLNIKQAQAIQFPLEELRQKNTIATLREQHKNNEKLQAIGFDYELEKLEKEFQNSLLLQDEISANRIHEYVTQIQNTLAADLAISNEEFNQQIDLLNIQLKNDKEIQKLKNAATVSEGILSFGKQTLIPEGFDPVLLDIGTTDASRKDYRKNLQQMDRFNFESVNYLRKNDAMAYDKLSGLFKEQLGRAIDDNTEIDGGVVVTKNILSEFQNISTLFPQEFKELIEQKKMDIKDVYIKRNNKFYDGVAVLLTEEGFQYKPISIDDIVTEYNFKSKEDLLRGADLLSSHTGNATSPEQVKEFIIKLKAQKINFNMLKLADDFEVLQELGVNEQISDKFIIGLNKKLAEVNTEVEKPITQQDLLDFLEISLPTRYYETDQNIVYSYKTTKEAGLNIDHKGYDQQYTASKQARRIVKEMHDNVDRGGARVAIDVFSIAGEKVTSVIEGFQSLSANNQLNDERGAFSRFEEKLNESRSLIDQLSAGGKEAAEREFLKFSLAYQIAMALQGGSGGRTISDQDVDNILRALSMDGMFQSPDMIKSSLTAIDKYLASIELTSQYKKDDRIKGYKISQFIDKFFNGSSIFDTNNFVDYMQENSKVGNKQTTQNSIGSIHGSLNIDMNNYSTNATTIQNYNIGGAQVPILKQTASEEEFDDKYYFVDQQFLDEYNGAMSSKFNANPNFKIPEGFDINKAQTMKIDNKTIFIEPYNQLTTR